MKKTIVTLAVATLTLVAGFSTSTVNIEKSTLNWKASKVSGEHWGKVKIKSGAVELNGNVIAGGEFIVDMTSITSEDLTDAGWNKKLVDHLKSDDFFSVEKHSTSKLTIKKSKDLGDGNQEIHGELTIKGITQPIVFNASKTDNGFKGEITVDRTLYDIKYGSGKFFEGLGDKMIHDEFTLTIDLVIE